MFLIGCDRLRYSGFIFVLSMGWIVEGFLGEAKCGLVRKTEHGLFVFIDLWFGYSQIFLGIHKYSYVFMYINNQYTVVYLISLNSFFVYFVPFWISVFVEWFDYDPVVAFFYGLLFLGCLHG